MPSVKLYSKLLAAVLVAFAVVSNAAPAIVPLAPVGAISATSLSSGAVEFYYQVSNGAIFAAVASGPFNNGNSATTFNGQLVPPGQALFGTPIAASGSSNTGSSFTDVHVFFYDPNNLLSEYYYTPSTSWQSGPGCTTCIQQSGFYGVNGSQALYAYDNPADGTVHVGFISAGSPDTLSEAIRTKNGGWSVATLPNP